MSKEVSERLACRRRQAAAELAAARNALVIARGAWLEDAVDEERAAVVAEAAVRHHCTLRWRTAKSRLALEVARLDRNHANDVLAHIDASIALDAAVPEDSSDDAP